MRIALHDSDYTGFPNYALMKLSAYHKAQGDQVEWWIPMVKYDRVYSSKIFTFSPEDPMLPPDAIKCGTGYGNLDKLPQEIDDMMPDYSIYPSVEHSIGFLTRGCIRKCPWCIVPKKEGMICPYRDWKDVKRHDSGSRNIVFMDNNVLAHDHGIQQMENMIGEDVRIDFNQGMDARLITPEVADIMGRLKWTRFVRMSCDTDAMLDTVLDKIDLLKQHGTKPYKVFVYLLVQDVASAEKRAVALRNAGVDVFAQPYRDFENSVEPTRQMKDLARWVNHKAIFNSVDSFADYKNHRRVSDE